MRFLFYLLVLVFFAHAPTSLYSSAGIHHQETAHGQLHCTKCEFFRNRGNAWCPFSQPTSYVSYEYVNTYIHISTDVLKKLFRHSPPVACVRNRDLTRAPSDTCPAHHGCVFCETTSATNSRAVDMEQYWCSWKNKTAREKRQKAETRISRSTVEKVLP